MELSIAEVERIAKLARISFSEQEKEKLRAELSKILDYVDQLKQLELKNEEELPDEAALNLMRDDAAEPVENPQEFISQAPEKEGGYLKVKSILE